MTRYDAIVVGTGGVGSAALAELARRGARVLGIDRFPPPHDRGSSHGQSRIIRQAYFEHPDYVPLLVAARAAWRELEAEVDRRLLFEIGLLEVGRPDGPVLTGVRTAADRHGLDVEDVSASDVASRWGGLHVPRGYAGVFEPSAGFLRVEACVDAHLDAARRSGAELETDVTVLDWTARYDGVEVRTSAGPRSAGHLVVTAGPWATRLLADLDLRLEVRRKTLLWYANDDPRLTAGGGCPAYFFELPDGEFYGLPQLDARGIKVSEHTGGQVVADPLDVDRRLRPDDTTRMTAFVESHLPGAGSTVTDHAVCLYTASPDSHFIVDRHPGQPRVVFAAGLSGHGFKFATVLGRALAEMTLDGRTDLPIEFLSLGRFR